MTIKCYKCEKSYTVDSLGFINFFCKCPSCDLKALVIGGSVVPGPMDTKMLVNEVRYQIYYRNVRGEEQCCNNGQVLSQDDAFKVCAEYNQTIGKEQNICYFVKEFS